MNMADWTTNKDLIQKLYIAFYGRPADPGGLKHWAEQLPDNAKITDDATKELIGRFVDSAEAQSRFGSPSLDATIDRIYTYAYGRDATTDDKAAYAGKTVTDVLVDVLSAPSGADATALANKLQYANWFVDYLDPNGNGLPDDDATGTKFVATYSGNTDATKMASAMLLKADATNFPTKAGVADDIVTLIADPGDDIIVNPPATQTFTLTENVETIIGNDADNTFNAYSKFTSVGQVPTLQSGDVVDGKGGVDTLNADLFGGTVVPTLSSIENLSLNDYDTVGSTLNLSSSTGVTSVNYKLIVSASTLDAVGNVVTLGATNVTGDRDLTLNYLATAVAGETNQVINVTGADLDDVVIGSAGAVETVTINVGAGESSIDGLSGTGLDDALTKVVITGEGKLSSNLTDNTAGTLANTKLATVDASAATGDLQLTVGVALDQNVKGGKGDDTLTFGATLTKDDTVDGGEGTDTIVATGTLNAAAYSNVTNIENVTMVMNGGDTNTTNTLNAGAFTGLAKVTVQLEAGQTTNSDDATVTGLAATTEVVVQDMPDLAAGVSDGTVDDITVVGANVSGTSDTLAITLNARRSGVDLTVDNLIAAGYETINLKSTGAVAANADIENVITNGITDAALKTLNISGDRELIVGGNIAATTVNASAMTAGGVTIGLGAADQVVTGSDFNDTFTIAYGNLTDKDTINGGEGTDTLNLTNAGAAMSFAGSTNAAKLKNVTGFEKLGISVAGDSIVLDDISMGAFTNNTVSVAVTADVNGTALDGSAVKNSNATLSLDTTKVTTAANITSFFLSNGKDVLEGGAGIDTVIVTDDVYIGAGDTLKGGSGNNNVLAFNDQGVAGATNTFAASQFTGVSGFNTWSITDTAAAGNAETFDITIDNAVAAANAHSTNSTLTINMDAAATGTDTLKLDASAVGAAVKLDVTGGNAGDTIKTGAGDDTIDGGLGADTITVGEGKDIVKITSVLTADTITDFNFGAAAGKTGANIDQLDLNGIKGAGFNWDGGFDTIQTITADATAIATDSDIIIMAHKAFDDAAAVDVYLEANNTGNIDGDLVVIYQDTLGRVRVAFADGDGNQTTTAGADYATADIAILTNLTLAGVKDIIDTGDFIVA